MHKIRIIDQVTKNYLSEDISYVNSYHNQGIFKFNMGKDLVPFAESIDGIIEGLYHKKFPILCIQWHPERNGPKNFCQEKMAINFLQNGPWWYNYKLN